MSGKVYGERFAMVPDSVLSADISHRAFKLWVRLQRYADPDGHCYPGRKRLAEELGSTSESTLDRAVKELVKAKLLKVIPRFDEVGDRTSNDFQVLTPSALVKRGGVTHDATVASPMTRELNPVERDTGTTYLCGQPAKALVDDWWKTQNPRPAQPYIAILKVAERALEVGWPPELLLEAMDNVPTISARWLEGYVNRHKKGAQPDRLAAVKRMLESET